MLVGFFFAQWSTISTAKLKELGRVIALIGGAWNDMMKLGCTFRTHTLEKTLHQYRQSKTPLPFRYTAGSATLHSQDARNVKRSSACPERKDLSLNIPNLKEAWREDELNKMELHEVAIPGV